MTAINPMRGEAILEAGERKTLKIVFDVNAFCYAEERLGKSTDEIVDQVTKEFATWDRKNLEAGGTPRINATLTRVLLWAGLQKHQPGTHMVEAGEIMSDVGVAVVGNAVLDAFYAAFGQAEKVEGEQSAHP